MDCEKFESAMMDELYGELDEVTSAAVKRHVAGCARCSALLGGMRATRRLATVPMVELPEGLEERILAAAREAQKVVPIRGRAARALSLAGSWAMRPQTAMAALFLVMFGTSVLLLRGRSARAPAPSEVTVTEHGAPAPAAAPAATAAAADQAYAAPMASGASAVAANRPLDGKPTTIANPYASTGDLDDLRYGYKVAAKNKEEPLARGIANASAPAGAPPNMLPQAAAPTTTPPVGAAGAGGGALGGFAQNDGQPVVAQAPPPAQAAERSAGEKKGDVSPFDAAVQTYRAGRFDDAAKSFDNLAPGDPNADLWAARSVRDGKGCRNALARFDRVAQRASGSPTGWDALLEGALCYRAVGDFANARTRLNALLSVDSHKDRARVELDRLNAMQQAQGSTGPAAGAAAPRPSPKRAAPAEPSKSQPPPNATVDTGF
jgi:TolA-binding protein